jgi:GPH family glycoside/pentoside/hexuronide:cation symporter
METNNGKIKLSEKLAYGLGDGANSVVWASVGAFMLFFFTDIAGLTAAVAGAILLWARVIDGFVDVLVGTLVDRTKTRFGKARPWILWMAVPFGLFTIMLFSVPDFSMTGKIFYYSIAYFSVNVIYSCINIPYGTLNSLITQDQQERQVLNIFRMLTALSASLVVMVGTTGFVKAFGNDGGAWQKTFIIYSVIAVVMYFFTFYGTKERVQIVTKTEAGTQATTKMRIASMLKNKNMWIVFALSITMFLSQGMSGINIYYCKYIFGDETKMGLLTIAAFAPMLLVLMVSAPFVKKLGKRNYALVGCMISIVGFVIMLMAPENFNVVLIGSLIKGLGMGTLTATAFPMVFDTIEYGEWKTGIRAEALTYSMSSVASKIGTAGGVAIVAALLSVGGYVAGADTQSDSAILAFKASFIYVQFTLLILTTVLLLIYKLDKIYPTMMKELEERRNV